jgi:4-carboxymuconolactone decarboxylase
LRLSSPRVEPLSFEEFRSLSWAQFGENVPESQKIKNVTLTWARHPALMIAQRSYQRYLHAGSLLPSKDQELVILRIGWLCQSEYEFGQHTLYGKKAGLTDTEISRIIDGSEADGWTPFESALLRAVDELYEGHVVSDATWNALAERYDVRQLMDLLVIVGRYWTVSVVLNTLGVQLEEGTPGFPDKVQ